MAVARTARRAESLAERNLQAGSDMAWRPGIMTPRMTTTSDPVPAAALARSIPQRRPGDAQHLPDGAAMRFANDSTPDGNDPHKEFPDP
jgi:hypothetical protein